ncbi:MAG: hypothetical protein P8Z36_00750 [Gemmatimonadota bacterium]|jgi:hypothetical protein
MHTNDPEARPRGAWRPGWDALLVGALAAAIAGGFVLVVAPDVSGLAWLNDAVSRAFFPGGSMPDGAASLRRWLYAVEGSTLMAFATLALGLALTAFRRRERWARNVLVLAVVVWFPLDTAASIIHGVWANVILNSAMALFLLLPLAALWNRFPKRAEAGAALVAMVVGLGLSGCGSTTEPDAPRYFPLAVGNTWTYAPENSMYGQPFEWQVTARHGDTISLARPAGASHAGTVTLLDQTETIDVLLGGDGFAPFYHFDAGASWVHRDPWDCDDGATFAVVAEPDPVVTPAGTFTDCIRIERLTTASCTDAGTTVEWWAPSVGLVRWEELNFYAGGPITFHLVDYSLE